MTWVAAAVIGGSLIGAYSSKKASDAQSKSAGQANDVQLQMFNKQNELNAPFRDNGLAAQNRLMHLLGLGSNSQQTREQIRASLLPQFTQNQPQRRGSRGQNGENLLAMPANAIDEAGLNAAIDKQFNAQGQGGDFGSLNKQFGAGDFNADPGYQWRLAQGQKGIDRSMAARGGLLSGAAVKASADYNQGAASQEYGNAYNRFQTDRSNILNPLQSLAGMGQTATGQMQQSAQNYGNNVGNNLMGAGNARASGYMGVGNALSGAIGQGANLYQSNQMMNKLFPYSGTPPASAIQGNASFIGPY